jgi:hypothetical protein
VYVLSENDCAASVTFLIRQDVVKRQDYYTEIDEDFLVSGSLI